MIIFTAMSFTQSNALHANSFDMHSVIVYVRRFIIIIIIIKSNWVQTSVKCFRCTDMQSVHPKCLRYHSQRANLSIHACDIIYAYIIIKSRTLFPLRSMRYWSVPFPPFLAFQYLDRKVVVVVDVAADFNIICMVWLLSSSPFHLKFLGSLFSLRIRI